MPPAELNAGNLPRLITWISKNPHNLPKLHGFKRKNGGWWDGTAPIPDDNDPDHDYKKTVIWVFSGKVIVGTIIQDKDGKVTFDGEFVTPQHPDGTAFPDCYLCRPGLEEEEQEKDELKALLRQEERAVDQEEWRHLRLGGVDKNRLPKGFDPKWLPKEPPEGSLPTPDWLKPLLN